MSTSKTVVLITGCSKGGCGFALYVFSSVLAIATDWIFRSELRSLHRKDAPSMLLADTWSPWTT